MLAEDWTIRGIRSRCEACLGLEDPWLRTLGRRVLATHPTRDGLSAARLAAFLRADRGLRLVWTRRYRGRSVRRWYVPAPAMGRTRLPLHGPLPPWATTGDVADHLQMRPSTLLGLADPDDWHRTAPFRLRNYRRRWLAARSAQGSHRLLEAPKDRLRRAQRTLLRDVLPLVRPHPACHGFVTGHSVRTCAAVHAGQAVLVRVDLRAFFVTVHRRRVAGVFRAFGFPSPVAWLLACLCTTPTPPDVLAALPTSEAAARADAFARYSEPHLPQGAPTSPALANLCAYGLDARIHGLAKRFGARYTRYADDLWVSGPRSLPATRLVEHVSSIVRDEGFVLNAGKTRVMGPGTAHRCLGLAVDVRPAVPRAERKRLEAILHNCVKHGASAQNRAGVEHWRAHLQGRVAWVASAHPPHATKLVALFDQIDWTT